MNHVLADKSSRAKFVAAVALVLTVAGLVYIPSDYRYDGLYWLSFSGALYLIYCTAAPQRALGAKNAGSPWIRGLALTGVLLFVLPELGMRAGSYHRTLYYERVGDALFQPIPNQAYMEKISMSPSRINSAGLRGGEAKAGERVILCLGDSIVYGYGLADDQTFPARLDAAIAAQSSGFEVLNGGVNAYPMALMHQRFLHLWETGVRPEAVVIGYSFNEGWLGHLVSADEATKDQFEQRVKLKNWLRTSAMYNVVMEKWAKSYYDAIKSKLVPGTHSVEADPANADRSYEEAVGRFLDDVRLRGVQPFFVIFAAFNGNDMRFNSDGPLHNRLAAFAEEQGVPYVRSDEAFRRPLGPDADLAAYFLDYAHMSPAGAEHLAREVAPWILERLDRRLSRAADSSE